MFWKCITTTTTTTFAAATILKIQTNWFGRKETGESLNTKPHQQTSCFANSRSCSTLSYIFMIRTCKLLKFVNDMALCLVLG